MKKNLKKFVTIFFVSFMLFSLVMSLGAGF